MSEWIPWVTAVTTIITATYTFIFQIMQYKTKMRELDQQENYLKHKKKDIPKKPKTILPDQEA